MLGRGDRPTRRLVGAGGALVLSAMSALGACHSSPAPAPSPSEAGAPSTRITIGAALSLTGGLSALGMAMNQALFVATQQINQVGILGGRQVTFDVRDDTSDPVQSRVVVQALLAEGVAGVLGPLSSGEVQNVQDLTYQARVVEITATATSTLLSTDQPAPDRYLFRTAPPDYLQGHAIVQFLRSGIPPSTVDAGQAADGGDAGPLGGTCRTIYIVYGNDAYGTDLESAVDTDFPSLDAGTVVLGTYPVPTTLQTSYADAVNQVVAVHPDCLVLIAYSDVGPEFLRELGVAMAADTAHDWSRFLVCGSDGEYDSNFIPNGQSDPSNPASPNATAGCYGTAPDTAPATPDYRAFRAIWQQSYPGQEPPAYASNQYDAAMLMALAIQKAGQSTDGTGVRDALRAITTPTTPPSPPSSTFGPADFVDAVDSITKGIDILYDGASGNCEFNPEGDVKTNYIVWQVQKRVDGTYAFATVGEIPSSSLQ
jgi:ABC-type branched-subunit amino acid transport system substrate-binding protein